jgi:hypothetical protein
MVQSPVRCMGDSPDTSRIDHQAGVPFALQFTKRVRGHAMWVRIGVAAEGWIALRPDPSGGWHRHWQ